NGADRRGVRMEAEVAPDGLDVHRIAADEPRSEVIDKQPHDRRAAGPDGVAVSGPDSAVAIENAHERGLLRDKALDRVGTPDLRLENYERELDAIDDGHGGDPWLPLVPILSTPVAELVEGRSSASRCELVLRQMGARTVGLSFQPRTEA